MNLNYCMFLALGIFFGNGVVAPLLRLRPWRDGLGIGLIAAVLVLAIGLLLRTMRFGT